jgi:hypothetical protein
LKQKRFLKASKALLQVLVESLSVFVIHGYKVVEFVDSTLVIEYANHTCFLA